MNEVFDKIHKKLPVDFGTGLAGIGWAVEYLIQNKTVEDSSLEVCEEIDHMIMKTDPRRLGDLTVELVNSVDEVVIRQQIRIGEDNMFYGVLSLPEDFYNPTLFT